MSKSISDSVHQELSPDKTTPSQFNAALLIGILSCEMHFGAYLITAHCLSTGAFVEMNPAYHIMSAPVFYFFSLAMVLGISFSPVLLPNKSISGNERIAMAIIVALVVGFDFFHDVLIVSL